MATSFKIEVIKSDGTKQIIHNTLATDVKIEPTAFKVTVDGRILFDGPAFNIETTKTDIPIASSATITSYPTTIEWGPVFSMSGPFVSGTAGIKDISLFIHATANKAYAVAKRDDSTKMWVINNIKFDRAGDKLMRIVTEDNNGNKQEATVTIKATDPAGQPQPGPTPTPQPTPSTDLPASVGPVLQAANLDDMFSKQAGMGVGQWVEVADGTFNNPTRRAISKAGIIVKAKNKGKVTITGQPIDLSGAGAVMHGFVIKTAAPATGLTISGKGAVLRNNVINLVNSGTSKWIVVKGAEARIENNEIFGKTTKEQLIQVNAFDVKILGNHVHDLSGMHNVSSECVMVGNSTNANVDYRCEIAFNRFEKIASEDELFTIKSCRNYIHDNTFVDNLSGVTFRHGHHNRFEDNTLIGTGFRMYGYNQEVKGNQMIDNPNPDSGQQCLIIGAGVVGGDASAGYEQVHDCVFERNIIVKTVTSPTPLVLGFGSGNGPTKNTFKENIIYGTSGTLTATGKGSWADQTMTNNIVFGATVGTMPAQNVDPKLQKQADGTYKYAGFDQKIKYLRVADVGPGKAATTTPLPIPPIVVIPPTSTPQPTPAGNKDKNGIEYPQPLLVDGFRLEYFNESTKWTKNFKDDGSARFDFEPSNRKSSCIGGYFSGMQGPDNEEVSAKLNGGPHSDGAEKTWADTIDVGLVNMKGTRTRLRVEDWHVNMTDIDSKTISIGDIRGTRSTGYICLKVNLDVDNDGKLDHVAIVRMCDTGGLDAAGKPKNEWKVLDKKLYTPAQLKPLKQVFDRYVETIGEADQAQDTIRVDGQDYAKFKYQFVNIKEVRAVKAAT